MMQALKRRLALLLTLALVLACLPANVWAETPAQPDATEEQGSVTEPALLSETDEPFSSYQDIYVGDTLTADITTAGAYVYFRFIPEFTHSYAFTSSADGDTYGYLYDANGNQLTSDDDGGNSTNFKVTYTLTTGETYYFGARWYNSSAVGAFPVSLNTDDSGHEYNEDGFCICGAESPYGKWFSCGENAEYCLTTDGTLTIRGTGAMDTFSAGTAPWYSLRTEINSVTMEEGVTSIGNYAFYNCSNLTSVSIPEGVTTIGNYGFDSCSSLTSVTIPEGVTTIGNYGFGNCSSLSSVTLPESVTSIAFGLFWQCDSLSSITIPDNVKSIGGSAFCGCKSLTSITIPGSVTSIEGTPFESCSSLNGIWVDERNPNYSNDESGVLFNKDKTALIQAPGGIEGEYSIPEGVTGIGSRAFHYCSNLTSITIPDSVTSIDEWTFGYCHSLISITIPDSVISIGSYAFYDCSSLTSVSISGSVAMIGSYAFANCSALCRVEFQGNAPEIASNSFYSVTADAIAPSGNETWTSDVMQNYGGTLNWIIRGEVTGLEITAEPNTTSYLVGDSLDLTGLGVSVTYDNGTRETLTADMVEVSADLSSVGRKTVTVRYGGMSAEFEIAVHNGSRQELDPSEYPESAHDYANNTDETKTVTISGFNSIILTFSGETKTESGCDCIYIYDGGGNQVGSYSGTQAAGLTVVVPGDTAQIRLWTDASVVYYGYSFSRIYGETIEHNLTQLEAVEATCTSDGHTAGTYCDICDGPAGEEAYEVIPALGHHYESEFTAGNADSPGYITYTCTNCGDVYRVEYDYYGEGSCGESLGWTLEEQILFLSGSGEMDDYSDPTVDITNVAPWYSIRDHFQQIKWFGSSTSIGDNAFYGTDGLTSVTIPNGIARIGNGAFAECANLTSITISASVTEIGDGAFEGCDNLVIYGCPGTAAETYAAENGIPFSSLAVTASGIHGDNLSWALYEDGTLIISGEGAMEDPGSYSEYPWYSYVSSIKCVVIEEGVTSIEGYAFRRCRNLACIRIPSSMTNIAISAFYDCNNLIAICVDEGNPNYSTDEFSVLFDKEKTELVFAPRGLSGEYSIPDSVTSIGGSAFSGCGSLTGVTIPSSLTQVGAYAFNECSNLESVYISDLDAWCDIQFHSQSANPLYNEADLYLNGERVTEVVISEDPEGWFAFASYDALTNVQFSNSVTRVAYGMFYNCSSLAEVDLPESLTSIDEQAFNSCSNLAAIEIPGGVTCIDNYAFYGCSGLSNVSIPYGVTSVGDYAFRYCSGLTSISIPDSLPSIDKYTFANCSGLTSITIPYGVTTISRNAFYGCGNLTSITIADSVTSIGRSAFYGCSSLASIDIPDRVTAIEGYTFAYCDSLTSIVIPASITTMADDVFYNCTAMNEIYFLGDAPSFDSYTFEGATATVYYPANNETWTDDVLQDYGGTITWASYLPPEEVASGYCGDNLTWVLMSDGVLTFSGKGAMRNYNSGSATSWYSYRDQITSIVLEDGITSIGDFAFYGLSNLNSIRIPEGVSTIGSYAFKNSTALDNVVLPSTLTRIGESAFFGCTSLSKIEIPEGIYTIWAYTFKNCTSLAEVTLPATLTKIDEAAFYGCSALTELTIPDSVSIIGIYCFKNCTSLTSVQLPAKLTEVREAAFYGTALTSLEIPEGVTKIGPYTFKNCTSLATLNLPESLTSIGEAAFYGSTVGDLVIPDAVTSIGSYAFKNCTNLASVQLPAGLTTVSEAAFYGCSGLTTLVIPDSVTSIGNYAFRNCTGLTSVTFGSGLTTIGESSFYGSSKLTNLEIPEGVTSIRAYAFKSCTGLTSVSLPSTLETIGDSAFYGCTGLTEITITTNVTSVGAYAFSRCMALKTVTFTGNAPTIGEGAFSRVVATVYYPTDNATWTSSVKQNYGGTLTWQEKV